MLSIRNSFSRRSLRNFGLCLVLAAVLGSPIGCGGGDSHIATGTSVTSPTRTGKASVAITWPPRTRLIPDAAESIVIRLLQGDTEVASQTLVRPEEGGTVTADFGLVPTGTLTAIATAHPNADGTGTAQTIASTLVEVKLYQTTWFRLTMGSTIESVLLQPDAVQMTPGQTRQLTASPLDATGATVLVFPANLKWASSNTGVVTVETDGKITSVGLGTATLTATESDSGKSASIPVTVSPVGEPETTEPQFAAEVFYPISDPLDEVMTADFDGDGNADVAIGSGGMGLLLFYGKGDGTLEKPVVLDQSTHIGVCGIADIDNDGRPDLLGGDPNALYLYRNQGGRHFAAPTHVFIGDSVRVVPLQRPGQPYKDMISLCRRPFSTGYLSHVRLVGGNLEQITTYPLPQIPYGLSLADLTGDGLPDIVVPYSPSLTVAGGVAVLPGQADGTFGATITYPTNTSSLIHADTSDFNADGRPDLAYTHYTTHQVSLRLNQGSTLSEAQTFPANSAPRNLDSADFDGDGWRDMVVVNTTNKTMTILWNRGGTFTRLLLHTRDDNSQSLAIADFNNDGKPDIVATSTSGKTISILLNTTP